MMTIEKQQEGNHLTLMLEGRMDTATAPELETIIRELPETVTELVIDLQKLDYMSSSGLRVLLLAQKTMLRQGELIVQNVNGAISEIFEITGFSDILTIR